MLAKDNSSKLQYPQYKNVKRDWIELYLESFQSPAPDSSYDLRNLFHVKQTFAVDNKLDK